MQKHIIATCLQKINSFFKKNKKYFQGRTGAKTERQDRFERKDFKSFSPGGTIFDKHSLYVSPVHAFWQKMLEKKN